MLFRSAIDSLYGAYLKVNYPLEYYTVVFGYYENDEDRTKKLNKELDYFGIKLKKVKFRYSNANYQLDKETNSIYKGLASIKYLNKKMAEELYDLRDKQYDNFIQLLSDIRMLRALIAVS